MTDTKIREGNGEHLAGEAASPANPAPSDTGDNNQNAAAAAAPAEGDPINDSASDPGSEDPGVPGADLRLLPPDSHRLVDRLRSVVRRIRCDKVPLGHLLTLGLVALVVVQVVILVFRAQEAPQTQLAEVTSAAEIRAESHICDRPGCVIQAAETAAFINHSVDPCKDFFQYACGRFKEVHPRPAGDSLDVTLMLQYRIRDRVLQLLREDQYYNSSSAISKARLFFSTCMRAYQFSLNNVPDLVDLLRQFGGLDLFGTWNPSAWNFNDILINASAVHLLDAFFQSVIWRRELGVVDLHVPATLDLTLSISTRLRGPPPPKTVSSRTRHLIREVLRQLEQDTVNQVPPPIRECNDTCVDDMAGDIIAVQEDVLAITPRRKFFALNTGPTSTRVTMSEMSLLVPQVDWRRLLDAMFGTDVVPDPVTFSVPSRAYMAGVGRIIDDTQVKRLHHFLMWPVIRRYLMALGPIYSVLGQELELNIPSRKIVETREQQCYKLLTTHMEPVLHGLLLASHIGEESVTQVRDHLLHNVFSVLEDSFGWMTEGSQNQSRKLLGNMQVDFALAKLKQTLNGLDEYYAPLEFRKLKFFDNLRSLYGFNKPGKTTELFRSRRILEDIFIGYSMHSNILTVPFIALQVPWYHNDVPDHLNAAALGSLVYQSLAEAFLINPFVHSFTPPNMTYFWDEETRMRFRKFTHCLESATQNSSTSALDSVLQLFILRRGISTKISTDSLMAIDYFFAYHTSYRLFERLKRQEGNTMLPGMQHTTSEQAFHLAFAQTRCTNGLPLFFIPAHISGKTMVAVTPRDPGIINHLILSDPGFREAYQCKGPVEAEHAMGLCSLF